MTLFNTNTLSKALAVCLAAGALAFNSPAFATVQVAKTVEASAIEAAEKICIAAKANNNF